MNRNKSETDPVLVILTASSKYICGPKSFPTILCTLCRQNYIAVQGDAGVYFLHLAKCYSDKRELLNNKYQDTPYI